MPSWKFLHYQTTRYEIDRLAMLQRLKRGQPIGLDQRLKPLIIQQQSIPPTPRIPRYSIGYPIDFSEFEIQAWLYIKLHKLGYDVRGEVVSTNPRARFDLVIFDDTQRPCILIEVKNNRGFRSPEQEAFYRSFGVTLIYCHGTSEFRAVIAHVQSLVKPTRIPKKPRG